MKHHKILMTGLAATLSMSAAAGNLTIQSQNEPYPITVKCGPSTSSEIDTQLPIPANGQRGPLPYILIRAMFHHLNLTCDFYETNNDIGSANLAIGSDYKTATITELQNNDPSHYSITLSTPLNAPSEFITAVIRKD
ncbi:MAG: hypothetical protein NTZ67_05065 [Gammaproteobacteria bacterium]|nr:hypothetical protein [Gammaproteobacteria bacterium]